MEACAGRLSRISNRPHSLCRNCRRWQYGTPSGITPDWRDEDGTASCGDRVSHDNKVGDGPAYRPPQR